MSKNVVRTTLAAALAPAGTLALSYPIGTNAGSFVGGHGHVLVTGAGDVFKSPQYFTLSFGATSITLTWNSGNSNTLPSGTSLAIELQRRGFKPQETTQTAKPNPLRVAHADVKIMDLGAPVVNDADGVAASQSVSAGASFTLNGALLSDYITGRMIFDVPRNVVAAWTTASVLTITGLDEYGNRMVEVTASGTSHTGKKAFKEILSVSSSASITNATVGTGNVFGLPVFLPSKTNILAEFQSGAMRPRIGGNIVYLQGIALEAAVDAGTGLNFVSPVAGVIRKMTTIAQTGITTGGAVTLEVNTVAVTGLSVTVADGSSEGDVDSDTPTYGHATTAVAVGDRLEVVFAAGFNAASDLYIIIEIEATQDVSSTIVVGNASAAQSGTSDDVRGTIAPSFTPDGTISMELWCVLPDPDFTGFDQYAG